jgi:hypothetical protein
LSFSPIVRKTNDAKLKGVKNLHFKDDVPNKRKSLSSGDVIDDETKTH